MDRFVAYYRVSTKAQGRSGLGLEAQVVTVVNFVADRGGELVGAFVDIESGRRDERTELWRAIVTARREGAALVIARLDRFSRRVSFISTLMEKGIRLVVVDMPNASDFQLHIFAALAQEERRLISIRTKSALAQAKAKGRVLGTHGRQLAEENRKRADEFAGRISSALGSEWETMNFSEAARRLNALGHRSQSGGLFYPQTVKNYWTRVYGDQRPLQTRGARRIFDH